MLCNHEYLPVFTWKSYTGKYLEIQLNTRVFVNIEDANALKKDF